MRLETIVENKNEFFGEICERSRSLLNHAFGGKNQAQSLKYLKNYLNDDEFLVICDFAKNYALVIQQAGSGFY